MYKGIVSDDDSDDIKLSSGEEYIPDSEEDDEDPPKPKSSQEKPTQTRQRVNENRGTRYCSNRKRFHLQNVFDAASDDDCDPESEQEKDYLGPRTTMSPKKKKPTRAQQCTEENGERWFHLQKHDVFDFSSGDDCKPESEDENGDDDEEVGRQNSIFMKEKPRICEEKRETKHNDLPRKKLRLQDENTEEIESLENQTSFPPFGTLNYPSESQAVTQHKISQKEKQSEEQNTTYEPVVQHQDTQKEKQSEGQDITQDADFPPHIRAPSINNEDSHRQQCCPFCHGPYNKLPSQFYDPSEKQSVTQHQNSRKDKQSRAQDSTYNPVTRPRNNSQIENQTEEQDTIHDPAVPSKIRVLSTNNEDGRSFDKKQYCPFCLKSYCKLPPHLEAMHSEEREVAILLSLPKRLKRERKMQLQRLRNLGNYKHNNQVIREQQGDFIVVYRPRENVSYTNYLPCVHCLGFYVRTDLYRHTRECKLKRQKAARYSRVQEAARLLLDVPFEACEGLRRVLSKISMDGISVIVKGDRLIISYGQKLFMRYGHNKDQHELIRRRLRDLARLLRGLRKTHGNGKILSDFMAPKYFKAICSEIKNIASFDETSNTFGAPSAAERIGLAVKEAARILQSKGLQNGEDELFKQVSGLLTCFDNEWKDEVGVHTRRTYKERHRNKMLVLPVTADVQKLARYMEKEGNAAYQSLTKNKEDSSAYRKLRDCILVSLMTFNRRRQGEVSKVKLGDMKFRKSKPNADIAAGLTKFETELLSKLVRIEIQGKRGRIVPILLTATLQKWVTTLLECRKDVGVLDTNCYFFARIGTDTHVRGSDVLREAGHASGAAHPDTLTTTLLRKHIATTSQILNLKHNELDILANFLGHDINVHRRFYRLPDETLQLAKVSKLLISMESGDIAACKGKNLDNIDIQDNEGMKQLKKTSFTVVAALCSTGDEKE